MIIYCDNLTIGACIHVIRLNWRNMFYRHNACKIWILDPLPQRAISIIIRAIMRYLGFSIKEADFFSGHLRTSNGDVSYIAALETSKKLSLVAAKHVLEGSEVFKRLNDKWGRNTLLKYVAGTLHRPLMLVVQRFLTAKALSCNERDKEAFLIVRREVDFEPDLLTALAPGLKVFFYWTWTFESLKRNRMSVLLFLVYLKFKEIYWLFESLIGGKFVSQKYMESTKTQKPSLLLLQEDDISLDRSYRTQPHWFFTENGKLPFRTFILEIASVKRLSVDKEAVEQQGISPISQKELYLLARRVISSNPVCQRLSKDSSKILMTSLFGSTMQVSPAFKIVRLLYVAKLLSGLCERLQVKSFMTCENYFLFADAMLLIAPSLNITTISYQYSNRLNIAVPQMLTTSDVMLTFSTLFHSRLKTDDIQPGKFINIGYIYDTSFEYIRPRVLEHKRRLQEAGSQFIICYFDENLQLDKYGLISIESHCTEIMALLRLVCNDPTIGVIIKTQFQMNSPQKFDRISLARSAAKETGRYIELQHGATRNIVFPAEAALSADIAIGHAFGATAALEAALIGRRCIMLNPYGFESDNDSFYTQADIIYPSIDAALKAIEGFRRGVAEHARLGDWTPIIDRFDPFRDGCASKRMRDLLIQVFESGLNSL